MKIRIVCSVLFGLMVALLSAFVCWMGGYNFDHRNPDVGFGSFMILLITGGSSALIFAAPYWEERK